MVDSIKFNKQVDPSSPSLKSQSLSIKGPDGHPLSVKRAPAQQKTSFVRSIKSFFASLNPFGTSSRSDPYKDNVSLARLSSIRVSAPSLPPIRSQVFFEGLLGRHNEANENRLMENKQVLMSELNKIFKSHKITIKDVSFLGDNTGLRLNVDSSHSHEQKSYVLKFENNGIKLYKPGQSNPNKRSRLDTILPHELDQISNITHQFFEPKSSSLVSLKPYFEHVFGEDLFAGTYYHDLEGHLHVNLNMNDRAIHHIRFQKDGRCVIPDSLTHLFDDHQTVQEFSNVLSQALISSDPSKKSTEPLLFSEHSAMHRFLSKELKNELNGASLKSVEMDLKGSLTLNILENNHVRTIKLSDSNGQTFLMFGSFKEYVPSKRMMSIYKHVHQHFYGETKSLNRSWTNFFKDVYHSWFGSSQSISNREVINTTLKQQSKKFADIQSFWIHHPPLNLSEQHQTTLNRQIEQLKTCKSQTDEFIATEDVLHSKLGDHIIRMDNFLDEFFDDITFLSYQENESKFCASPPYVDQLRTFSNQQTKMLHNNQFPYFKAYQYLELIDENISKDIQRDIQKDQTALFTQIREYDARRELDLLYSQLKGTDQVSEQTIATLRNCLKQIAFFDTSITELLESNETVTTAWVRKVIEKIQATGSLSPDYLTFFSEAQLKYLNNESPETISSIKDYTNINTIALLQPGIETIEPDTIKNQLENNLKTSQLSPPLKEIIYTIIIHTIRPNKSFNLRPDFISDQVSNFTSPFYEPLPDDVASVVQSSEHDARRELDVLYSQLEGTDQVSKQIIVTLRNCLKQIAVLDASITQLLESNVTLSTAWVRQVIEEIQATNSPTVNNGSDNSESVDPSRLQDYAGRMRPLMINLQHKISAMSQSLDLPESKFRHQFERSVNELMQCSETDYKTTCVIINRFKQFLMDSQDSSDFSKSVGLALLVDVNSSSSLIESELMRPFKKAWDELGTTIQSLSAPFCSILKNIESMTDDLNRGFSTDYAKSISNQKKIIFGLDSSERDLTDHLKSLGKLLRAHQAKTHAQDHGSYSSLIQFDASQIDAYLGFELQSNIPNPKIGAPSSTSSLFNPFKKTGDYHSISFAGGECKWFIKERSIVSSDNPQSLSLTHLDDIESTDSPIFYVDPKTPNKLWIKGKQGLYFIHRDATTLDNPSLTKINEGLAEKFPSVFSRFSTEEVVTASCHRTAYKQSIDDFNKTYADTLPQLDAIVTEYESYKQSYPVLSRDYLRSQPALRQMAWRYQLGYDDVSS